MEKILFSFFFIFLFSAPSSAALFCEPLQKKDCRPLTSLEELQKSQCLISKKMAHCDQWQRENPEAANKMRNCDQPATCSTLTQFAEYGAACATGLGSYLWDSAKDAYHFIVDDTQMSPELKTREEFFNQCTTPECKRQMLGPYVGLFSKEEIEGHPHNKNLNSQDPANATYLQGLSSKTLYYQLLFKLKKKMKNKALDEAFLEPWSGEPALKKIMTLNEMIDLVLEKAGVKNTECYAPEVLTEMRCYAAATLMDPLSFSKGIFLISKAAGLSRKMADKIKDSTGVLSKLREGSVAGRYKNIAAYPELVRTIDSANKTLRETEFNTPVKNIENIEWEKYTEDFIPSYSAKKLGPRLKELDPEIKNSIHGVHQKMNDRESFIAYMENLNSEVVAEIERRAIPKELEDLKKGQLSEKAALRVLVQRAQSRDEGPLSIIVKDQSAKNTASKKPTNNPEAFREAVAQGPFFDKVFKNGRHGMASHLLQKDYVADVIHSSTQGNPSKFWNYMGSKKGVNYWVALFDSSKLYSLSNPEFLTRMTRKYVNIP